MSTSQQIEEVRLAEITLHYTSTHLPLRLLLGVERESFQHSYRVFSAGSDGHVSKPQGLRSYIRRAFPLGQFVALKYIVQHVRASGFVESKKKLHRRVYAEIWRMYQEGELVRSGWGQYARREKPEWWIQQRLRRS